MKYNDIIKILQDLEKKEVTQLDLDIVSEIEMGLFEKKKKMSDPQKEILWETTKNMWLKSDDLETYDITRFLIDNFNFIGKLSTWELIDKCKEEE